MAGDSGGRSVEGSSRVRGAALGNRGGKRGRHGGVGRRGTTFLPQLFPPPWSADFDQRYKQPREEYEWKLVCVFRLAAAIGFVIVLLMYFLSVPSGERRN